MACCKGRKTPAEVPARSPPAGFGLQPMDMVEVELALPVGGVCIDRGSSNLGCGLQWDWGHGEDRRPLDILVLRVVGVVPVPVVIAVLD